MNLPFICIYIYIYSLGLASGNIAIENGPVEIVSFPINSMVIFHSILYVYQRVQSGDFPWGYPKLAGW